MQSAGFRPNSLFAFGVDIFNPIRLRHPGGKGKKFGQKGHQHLDRPDFTDDERGWLMQYTYQECPCCGGPVTADTNSP